MFNYMIYALSPLYISLIFRLLYRKPVSWNLKIKKKYVIICSFAVFFTFAFRHYSVGNDCATYYKIWEHLSNIPVQNVWNTIKRTDLETGYLFSNWVLSHVFPNPQFVFIFSALLYSVTIGCFMYKNCDDPVVGFMFFNAWGMFNFFVSGIRQSIAICICIWSIGFAKKRKFIPFVLLVLLAAQFHMTAMAFLIVWFLPKFKMNIKYYTLTTIGSLIGFIFIDRLMNLMNFLINDHFGRNTDSVSGGIAWLLICVFLLVMTVVLHKKADSFNGDYSTFFYMLVIAVLTFVLRYTVIGIAERITHYFSIAAAVLLPKVIHAFSDVRLKTLIRTGFIVLSIIAMVYKLSLHNHLIPYCYFWQV